MPINILIVMDVNQTFLNLGILFIGVIVIVCLACLTTYWITHRFYQRKFQQSFKADKVAGIDAGEKKLEQLSLRIQDLEYQINKASNEVLRQAKRLNGMLMIYEASRYQDSPLILYDRMIGVVKEVTGFSFGSIHLLEPGGKYVYLVASKNVPGHIDQVVVTESLDRIYMQPLSRQEPYRLEEYYNGQDVPSAILDKLEDFKSGQDIPGAILVDGIIKGELVKIPLLAQERLVGTLTISNNYDSKGWFDAEKNWLGVIGRQLGMLIDQIIISEQLQNKAVLQERERISQELHDNLSQFVGTIRLLSERITENLKTGDITRIEQDTENIESIARDAYANIREEMVGLRFIQHPDQEIIPLISEYLKRFQRQWNIEVEFEVVNIHEPIWISPGNGAQLFRIIQEALINVRRHAQATRVEVTLEVMGNTLLGNIKDNGIGFDTQDVFENRLGLRIMRERAYSTGGSLHIISDPGSGTIVQIELPMSTMSMF